MFPLAWLVLHASRGETFRPPRFPSGLQGQGRFSVNALYEQPGGQQDMPRCLLTRACNPRSSACVPILGVVRRAPCARVIAYHPVCTIPYAHGCSHRGRAQKRMRGKCPHDRTARRGFVRKKLPAKRQGVELSTPFQNLDRLWSGGGELATRVGGNGAGAA
jgi:hypothetical protein